MTATLSEGRLISAAELVLRDAGPAVRAMCDHLVEHGARLDQTGGGFRLGFAFGQAQLDLDGPRLRITAFAPDIVRLHQLRGMLAAHLIEFAPEAEAIRWIGDGADLRAPPNWRELRVVHLRDLTPRMRRIRFQGEDLGIFAGLDNIHVRLAFPPPGAALHGPDLTASGRESWPDHPGRPRLRRYTIRRIDVAAGWLDVDFVLHEEASGPGSAFAISARPGDVIGMIGPGGGSIPLDRDWYLIAGDETALPAIIRMAALLPQDAQGAILIEVHDPAEAQPVPAPPGMTLRYLSCGQGLLSAATALAPPQDSIRPYVWVGCEYGPFRELRAHVRNTLVLGKECHSIVAYWRQGREGD